MDQDQLTTTHQMAIVSTRMDKNDHEKIPNGIKYIILYILL